MKKWIKRVLSVLLIAAVVSYLYVQVSEIIINGVRTTVATAWTIGDTTSGKAVFLRDEKIIEAQHQGNYDYAISDGSKVSAGEEIARVYESPDDLIMMSQIDQLQKTLEILKSVSAGTSTNPETLSRQIADMIGEMDYAFANNQFDSTNVFKTELLARIYRREASVGMEVDFSEEIAGIESQIKTLKASVGGYSREYATMSGYFVSGTDGYESVLAVNNIENLTVDEIKSIASKQSIEKEKGTFGKMVQNYDWYIVLPVDNGATWISPGKEVYIKFNGLLENEVQCKVEYVLEQENMNLAFFKCSIVNSDLFSLRTQNVTIRSQNKNGIRIPADAIHIVDGEKGVYILSNRTAYFKKVNVLVQTGDFLLCENVIEDGKKDDYVQVYDEIIVAGRDLYDGKRVK